MTRTEGRSGSEALLEALEALEEAVFVDYAMAVEPLPRTAAALRQAREVIRRAKASPLLARSTGSPHFPMLRDGIRPQRR
jgi:hypothetical protein